MGLKMPADKTLDGCTCGKSPHTLSSGVPEAQDSKGKLGVERV